MAAKVSPQQRQDPLDEKLMTASEVADYLSMHVSSLHRLVRNGFGPRPVRLSPKLLRWQPSTLRAWMTENQKEGQAS